MCLEKLKNIKYMKIEQSLGNWRDNGGQKGKKKCYFLFLSGKSPDKVDVCLHSSDMPSV